MPVLQLTQLSKSFHDRCLFKNLTLDIDAKDHLGFIGENGTGKSTLLDLICGEKEPESGQIYRSPKVVISRFRQREEAIDFGDHTALHSPTLEALSQELRLVEQEMGLRHDERELKQLYARYSELESLFHIEGGFDYAINMAQILAGLGFDANLLDRPLKTLSGGERARVRLAQMLVKDSDLLLLDEPGNHLDFSGLNWLERFLKQWKKAFILVSHDRWLLNSVCDSVIELANQRLYRYRGNYQQAQEQKAQREALEAQSLERLEEKLKHEEAVTQTLLSHRNISGFHAREKVVAKLSEKLQAQREATRNLQKNLKFGLMSLPEDRRDEKRLLIESEKLSLSFNKLLFENFSHRFLANDRIAILGPNGCGKTSLLRIFLGDQVPDEGRIRLYGDPSVAYMGQHVDLGDESQTVYTYLEDHVPPQPEHRLRSRLAQFGFIGHEIEKELRLLSGGERHRLFLCQLLEQRPDILILDEPTNHLDLRSRELLEKAIQSFGGLVLIVSHDRQFVENLAQRYLGFIGSKIESFDRFDAWFQAYDHYRAASSLAAGNAALSAKADLSSSQADQPSSKAGLPHTNSVGQAGAESKQKEKQTSNEALSRENPAQRRKRIAALRQDVSQIEKRIAELETLIQDFERPENMASHQLEDYTTYAENQEELEHCYETLFEKMELLEAESAN